MIDDETRGLTKQRNFGINKVNENIDIVCFLDDDTVLESNYFENLLSTYDLFPEATGVGGYICNETKWEKVTEDYIPKINEFFLTDGNEKMGVDLY